MNQTPLSFNQLLDNIITQIINPLIMLIAAAAFILFLYEVYQLIRSAGGDTEHADAKRGILWSFIGLVIIFSVYGILNIVTSTFHLKQVTRITTANKNSVHYIDKYDTNYNIKGYTNKKPAATQKVPEYLDKNSAKPSSTGPLHFIRNYLGSFGTK